MVMHWLSQQTQDGLAQALKSKCIGSHSWPAANTFAAVCCALSVVVMTALAASTIVIILEAMGHFFWEFIIIKKTISKAFV